MAKQDNSPELKENESDSAEGLVTTASSNLSTRESIDKLPSDRTLAILEQLKTESASTIKDIVEGTIQLAQSTDPSLILAHADAKRRHVGMWLGALLSTINIIGGTAILVSSAPASLGIGLLCLGATCAGATFAIITGKPVSTKEFSEMFNIVGASFGKTGRRGRNGQ